MSKSIMQTEKKCYVSGATYNLDLHHCMMGTANRKLADKYGLTVWLRHDIHMDLHDRNTKLKTQLKQDAQKAFEKKYSHDKWMEVFGVNYL